MSTDTTTRRGLLRLATSALAYGAGATAVTATGFAISEAKGATPITADRTAWTGAIAECERTSSAVSGFDWKATDDLSPPEFDTLCDRERGARDALLLMPAPDWAAVELKIAKMRAWYEGGMVDDENLAAIQADVRRLAGQEGR
jgi:hypothetical protein